MSDRFEMIEHPSDTGIKAFGKDYKEVFENTAFGMFSIMAEIAGISSDESFTVKVTGDDYEDLMVNWLNELIYLVDSKHFLFKEFNISKLSDKGLEAVIKGEHIKKDFHLMHRQIKAATFNSIELTKTKASVTFDV